MKKCERCGGLGYIENFYAGGASFTPSLTQCCDISAYSNEVQRRLNNPAYFTETPVIHGRQWHIAPLAQVIPFRTKNNERV